MRAHVLVMLAVSGCADILGIQDRYFDGGTSNDGSPLDSPTVDAPQGDGSTGCTPCTNGAGCETIACHQDTPTAITVNGSKVFWADSNVTGASNAVMSADIGGGNVATAYSAGANELPSLVTLQNEVYVSTFTGNTIVKVSTQQPIASTPYAYALAVDTAAGYFAYSSFGNSGIVFMCGVPDTCSTGIQIIGNQANVQGTAIDDTNVYWSTTTGTAGIYVCSSQATCTTPKLLDTSGSPTLVAVDNTYVYWVDDTFTSATIWRANKADGTNKIGIASTSSSVLAFVLDGGNVYYAAIGTSGDGKIVRVKNDGTGSTDLATGLKSAAGVAVDSAHAYFTEWGPFLEGGIGTDGRVMRVPK